MAELPPKANTPDLYKINSCLLDAGFCKWEHQVTVGFDYSFHIHSENDMISHSCPAACSQLHPPVAHSWKLRGRVAVTAAVRLCLFAVTLQWSTQLSSACLTAERHRVTLNMAWLLPLAPPIAATHEISPARPSQLRPLVTTNKVVFSRSVQHAAPLPHRPHFIYVLLTTI